MRIRSNKSKARAVQQGSKGQCHGQMASGKRHCHPLNEIRTCLGTVSKKTRDSVTDNWPDASKFFQCELLREIREKRAPFKVHG
jgi:hypothetical protein